MVMLHYLTFLLLIEGAKNIDISDRTIFHKVIPVDIKNKLIAKLHITKC